MIPRKFLLTGAAVIAAGAGAAGAIAATTSDERKQAETAVLSDAANRLDVSAAELRDALAKAQDAQIVKAVADGKLTAEQAERIKERRAEHGTVLGLPGGPRGGGPGHHRGGGPGGPGAIVDAAATALGLERSELVDRLRGGDTLEEIAKAEGKSLESVKSAVREEAEEKLAQAVEDEKITAEQRTEMLERFDEMFDRFASGEGPARGAFKGRGHHGPGGGPFGGRPPAHEGSGSGASFTPGAGTAGDPA